jgi:ribosomal protein S12 methylthiotransferase accessory factor
MRIDIRFPGGARVDASFDAHVIRTDQPPHQGGNDSAPTPFATFLASIGTCAGIYVLGFCRQRGIPTEGIHLAEEIDVDPLSGMVRKIRLEIDLPSDFPAKYRAALIRSAEQCAVKKHLEHPPEIEVTTRVEPQPAGGKMLEELASGSAGW